MKRDRLILTGGWLLDVWEGRYMPEGSSLLLENGRITRILAPGADLPEGETLQLDGRWVIPALLNTHGHIQLVTPGLSFRARDLVSVHAHRDNQIDEWLGQCLAHGIGTIQDSGSHSLQGNQELVRRRRAGQLECPRIQQAVLVAPEKGAFSPRRNLKHRITQKLAGIRGEEYDSPLSGILVYGPDASEQDVRDAVNRAIDERGADLIKLYDQKERSVSYTPGATVMTQEQIDAAADQARTRGVPTAMHHVTVESFRRGVKAGVDTLVHLPMDDMLDEQDIDSMLAAGTNMVPTMTLAWFYSWDLDGQPCHEHPRATKLAGLRTGRALPMTEAHWLPPLRGAAQRCIENTSRGAMKMMGTDMSHIFEYWSAYVTRGMDNVKLACTHGALGRMGFGTDFGAAWCGPSLIETEIEMFRLCLDGEIDPLDLLRIATIQSAAATGLQEKLGTIDAGKIADLAILSQDPLTSTEVLGRPVAAMISGGELVVDGCGLAT